MFFLQNRAHFCGTCSSESRAHIEGAEISDIDDELVMTLGAECP
jgi:hypothetical protein